MKIIFNTPLAAATSAWAIAQIIIAILYLVKEKEFRFERLLGSGGMPSSHSAAVCALTSQIGKVESIYSPIFALAIMFSLVVMYDASGVRRQAGFHAKIINSLMNKLSPEDDHELKEFLGHSPLEVLFGAILGVIIGILVW